MPLPDGLLLTFYGDDFTGSTDGMEALARAGLRAVLFLKPPRPEQISRFAGLRAVGVAGVSRSLSPDQMDAELPHIFTALRALTAPLFHVKICSTFDSAPHVGSIGHTIEIGQRIFASPFVPLVVGAPILNRFCVFGNLFARSGPESEVFRLDRHPTMSRHPVTPMDESDLGLHLARQTTRSIGLVDALMLDAGAERVQVELQARRATGAEIVLFDTLTNAHLLRIGELLWKAMQETPLFAVGSSGVEYALTEFWKAQGWLPTAPSFTAKPVEQIAVVSGSCSPVTARQIAWAEANGFASIPLDSSSLLDEASRAVTLRSAAQSMLTAVQAGRSVIAHTCQGPDDPRLAISRTASHETGKLLGSALGHLLREVLIESGIRRAVVAGGDTSGYVARELGLEALETVTPMAPGSPLCRAYAPGSPLDGLEILFKGGQVGKVDLFGSILRGAI